MSLKGACRVARVPTTTCPCYSSIPAPFLDLTSSLPLTFLSVCGAGHWTPGPVCKNAIALTEPHPWPLLFWDRISLTSSGCPLDLLCSPGKLRVTVFLPLPTECWNHRVAFPFVWPSEQNSCEERWVSPGRWLTNLSSMRVKHTDTSRFFLPAWGENGN